MQSKLSQNQTERVREKYRDHPLLVACDRAFGCYNAELQELLFSPEEIFLEAAIILDTILTEPENAKLYVGSLWNSLKTKIRYFDKAPQEDLVKVTGAIFYVVTTVLCQHPHPFFKEELMEMMLSEVREKMHADEKEEQRFIIELSRCAEGLEEWLMDYIESEEELSEEIIDCLVEPRIEIKKGQQKPKAKKKAKDVSLISDTFEYNKDGQNSGNNRRLGEVFTSMKAASLIATDTDLKHFLEIFYGGKCHNKIAWTGKLNMLHYVFNEWVNKRKYVKKPTAVGLWQLVAAHFYLQKEKDGEIEKITLTADDVKDSRFPKNVSDDIDIIIEMLNPLPRRSSD